VKDALHTEALRQFGERETPADGIFAAAKNGLSARVPVMHQ
jgi:hypothetical protein